MRASPQLTYNISKNGANGDWYWEVIAPERDIIARGLAPSSAEARAAAVQAGASYLMPPAGGEAPGGSVSALG